MNKIFFLFIFVSNILAINWRFEDILYLKKDEVAVYNIIKNDKKHILKFRWTLFKNGGLVMLYNYDNFPYQNILYKDMPLNSFKLNLYGNKSTVDRVYVLIVFDNIINNNFMKLSIYFFDNKQNLEVDLKDKYLRKRDGRGI